jgi:multiple sugar transport system substrate-binding protein
VIVGDDGKPNVATPEAAKGLQTLADWFKDGSIPKAATTWKEEEGRKAFQSGKLIFHRNWGYVYNIAQKTDGSSKVAGKFGVAPLPGIAGPGVSSLGGHNAAIAKNAENKGTAADFLKFLAAQPQQKSAAIYAAQTPTIAAIYTDPDAVKALPYLPIQLKSVEGAKPRPIAVEYGDVSLAITDAAYSALQAGADGQTADAAATLQTLQAKLQTLIK